MGATKRVAIAGMHLESNAFAPAAGEADFRERCWLEGEAILAEAAMPAPAMPPEVPGFIAEMNRGPAWTPVPIVVTAAEPGGPVDHAFFQRVVRLVEDGLRRAGRLDGVYVTNHGAMTSTENPDPDGIFLAAVRKAVGPNVPIAVTLDLHTNVSERMVEAADVLVVYRTNPHVDQAARAAEAARHLRELMSGVKARSAFIRLPLTPSSVTLLTASGPYAEAMAESQRLLTPELMNVSVAGGFVFSNTPKNGVAVIATARNDVAPARRAALSLARKIWAERGRFTKELTPLSRAVEIAQAAMREPAHPAVIFSDAGDNPGGGGRGNTAWLLEALYGAGVREALLGVFCDRALAADAHAVGEGGRLRAVFNRVESEFSRRFEAEATVLRLSDGRVVGRRGLYAGQALDLGPSAAIDLGGIVVAVASRRLQCADPVMFEMFGLDIARARTVVVKSRGHFRAGFDEFFKPEQVYEVDTPGLTSPVLSRLNLDRLPRPSFPLDPDAAWREPAWAKEVAPGA